ncbi:MAG TPA: AsmA family protein [Vicinamibacterales bacterium]|nr:AsmA family protein [Vicinamibacterales bacterium]
MTNKTKKVLVGLAVLVLVVIVGALALVKVVLGHDSVREALAAQLSKSIGQPVTISGIGAGIYPRVTVNLEGVEIGQPARISVRTLHVGTDFRALLSRQIAHASLRLDGARIELPLPAFATATDRSTTAPQPANGGTASPVQLVSIDEIALHDVEIVSGGRTLRGDIEASLESDGFLLRTFALRADDTIVEATGKISDINGPVGDLTVKADRLSFDRLMAFAADFSKGSGLEAASTPSTEPSRATKPAPSVNPVSPSSASPAPKTVPMKVAVTLTANRATMGTLAIEKVSGQALLTDQGLTLEPITFELFNGRYQGSLKMALGDNPDILLNASLSDVDMGALTTYAGSKDALTGRLTGRIDLSARGSAPTAILESAKGTARVDIVNGSVKNLGLVRAVVLATSMRTDSMAQIKEGARNEPFSRLGATLTVGNGAMSTQDLKFESTDISLGAAGSVQLNGSAIDLKGQVQLSQVLSQQAGRELVRYTQDQGRVTLPATIGGSAEKPAVRIDLANMAERAVRNKATEAAQDALKKGLGKLFSR